MQAGGRSTRRVRLRPPPALASGEEVKGTLPFPFPQPGGLDDDERSGAATGSDGAFSCVFEVQKQGKVSCFERAEKERENDGGGGGGEQEEGKT